MSLKACTLSAQGRGFEVEVTTYKTTTNTTNQH
jgi:hypothetical protein